jgi:hypothetical protein
MTQLELPLATQAPTANTLNAWVLAILNAGRWWMPHELCQEIRRRHSIIVSDSSATARLRDLRKPRYGAHVIEKQRRANSSAYEYRLVSK